jgi:predicted PurR-regulated permease PerM
VPLAFVIGPLAGAANVVPLVGGLVGMGSAMLVAALEGNGWTPFLGIAITFAVGQALESLVLTPRIVGERVGLSPFAVILAVAAFGEAFGFIGVLLAVPLAAVLKTLAPDARRAWRESRYFDREKN